MATATINYKSLTGRTKTALVKEVREGWHDQPLTLEEDVLLIDGVNGWEADDYDFGHSLAQQIRNPKAEYSTPGKRLSPKQRMWAGRLMSKTGPIARILAKAIANHEFTDEPAPVVKAEPVVQTQTPIAPPPAPVTHATSLGDFNGVALAYVDGFVTIDGDLPLTAGQVLRGEGMAEHNEALIRAAAAGLVK
jgi:hypothetical protein